MSYPGYGPPSPQWGAVAPQPRNGFGTAGLVLGIIALVFSFIPIVGVIAWPLAIAGLILGIVGINRVTKQIANNKGVAIGGVVCSGIALFVCMAWVVGLSVAGASRDAAAPTAAAGSTTSFAPLPAAPSTDTTEASIAEPTVINVKQMAEDFESNQLAAEKEWGGQYVQFTAPVGNITSSSVTFTDLTAKFSLTQVACRFEDESTALTLAKGKPATVRGIVSDDQLLGVISLDQCEILG